MTRTLVVTAFAEIVLAPGVTDELHRAFSNLFVQAEVLRETTTSGLEAQFPVPSDRVAGLLALVEDGTINGKIAKDVFADMVKTGKSARQIVDGKGLAQVTDTAAIEAVVRGVVQANLKEVEKYRAGKTSVKGFFVGQIMKATRGTANAAIVNELLDKVLGEA